MRRHRERSYFRHAFSVKHGCMAPTRRIDVEWDSRAVRVNQQAFQNRTGVRRLTLNDRGGNTRIAAGRCTRESKKIQHARQLYLTALNYIYTRLPSRHWVAHVCRESIDGGFFRVYVRAIDSPVHMYVCVRRKNTRHTADDS